MKLACGSGASSTFTRWCKHHHYIVLERPDDPTWKPVSIKQSPAILPSLQLGTTSLLSVSMDLPTVHISHKWTQTTCGLSCLASLTERHLVNVHPLIAGVTASFPFMAEYGQPTYTWFIHSSGDRPCTDFGLTYFIPDSIGCAQRCTGHLTQG